MPAKGTMPPAAPKTPLPALWHEPAPHHFDLHLAWWIKLLVIVAATLIALQWLDLPLARWALDTHPIPNLANPAARHNDIARELMLLEQWGQWTCSIFVIAAVALIDKAGRRRALALAIGCFVTVAACYLLKDLFGRSRPYIHPDASWVWGGPAIGFHNGSPWGSFPSAHTTGAFALSVGLSWFYPRARALFMALALITAAQRILHAAHYLSDTLAGMGIAVLLTRLTFQARFAGRLMSLMPRGLRHWFLETA